MSDMANKSVERQQLAFIIRQWNANRVDLFELSEPNEDLEFHGVMRFYFQDAGQKVATKCIRVSSTASSQDVIQTLIEKFRPDFRMLSVPEYALYEIHESGEERKLSEDEKPLLVQLNWHKDDREGRFLLRRMDEKTYLPGFDTDSINFKRRLSKKKKKEKKKKEKKETKESNDKDKDGIAQRLYTEIPETSFTRSISNPEAVMRRRRQQKLEKKLQQLCQEGGPEAGGTLRIFGESLNKDVPYKTLLLSTKDTVATVVKEILNKYGKDNEDPLQFCLVQLIVPHQTGENGLNDSLNTSVMRQYILDDDDCPLFIEKQHDKKRSNLTFHVKRRPADYQPRKRKKKPEMIKGELDAGYTKYDEVMEKLPYLDINPKTPSENHVTNITESLANEQSPTTDTPTISEERDLYEHPAGPELVTIQLQKSNNCMGLSIVAAKGPHQEKMGIFIKSVVKGGAADLDGRLQAGDQLIKVDGHPLIGISQERAAELISQTGAVVTLEVARQAALYNGLALLLNQPSPLTSRGLEPENPPRRMSEAQIPMRPRNDNEYPRPQMNGYNGYPPHMQPYIRQPCRSVPVLNSNAQEPRMDNRNYPASQPPHSRTSSTASIPRAVAENIKQVQQMQPQQVLQPPYKQLPPEGLQPNSVYNYSQAQFQQPRSPGAHMLGPYTHSNVRQRPEMLSTMTLPNHGHQAGRYGPERPRLPINGVPPHIPPHIPPHVARMQASRSVPTLNNDPVNQPRLEPKAAYSPPHPAQYTVVTSTTLPQRYILDPVTSRGTRGYQKPIDEEGAPEYRQMYNQQHPNPGGPNQTQYNPNANLSRPNSQMSIQSQPNQRTSYHSPYSEERHYQNISMYLMNPNAAANGDPLVNGNQQTTEQQQQQFRQKLLHQQQLQQQRLQQQQHQQQQQQQQHYNHNGNHQPVPQHHHISQQQQRHLLQQQQEQQMQQVLQQERLQRLKLEEIRRQQELQLAQQAEERLIREAKRRQGEELRQNKNQNLRFELPNNHRSDDVPPPLPKSPPPLENNAHQRLDRLLLTNNSSSSDNLDKMTESGPPTKPSKGKDAPNQTAPKPKVSWNDSTPTVLNLETTATNGPTNNIHSFTLQDIDEVLDIEDDPEFSNTFNVNNTPNVIGAQEVYRDPRERIKAEKMRHQQQNTAPQVPEKLSFKEKMKMFAKEAGQNDGIKDKVKISKAQREIETGPHRDESDSEGESTTEENK